jgi:thiamine biosynthesis lipoprotein
MGTTAHLTVTGGPSGLLDELQARIVDLEMRWSRFLPESEISVLNRNAGLPVTVSVDTIDLVERAITGWEATYGLFDPTVLGDLERAGYDRTFEQVGMGAVVASCRRRGCDDIEVDAELGIVRLPDAVGFDPGGIGKGLAADLVVADALAAGAEGVLVELGGDLRVSGAPPDGSDCWRIRIAPVAGVELPWVRLTDGAVATSARTRRRWIGPGGQPRHHLIDPSSGDPSESDVLSATAVAAEGWQAEVLAKAAFIGGPVQGVGLADQLGGAAAVVTVDWNVATSPGWDLVARQAA